MRVINNIHAKDMIFGMNLNYYDNKAHLRTILAALNRDWFFQSNCQWNYVDGDLNIEVIELFVRRLMSFTI